MKRKSFPFYYEKYIAGTAFLTRREKGAYVDLLCYQADKGGMTIENIKNILNGDFDCWDKLKEKFFEENGMYYNRKMKEVKEGKKPPEPINPELLQKRKDKFYNDLKPFLVKYPKEMLRAFFDYWTEKNKSGTYMRFELERVFEISRRLATWARNDKGFKNDQIKTHTDMLELTKDNPALWNQYKQIKRDGKLLYQKT